MFGPKFGSIEHVCINLCMYKPSRCNKGVIDMAWISRALNTIIGRAKTQMRGKFFACCHYSELPDDLLGE